MQLSNSATGLSALSAVNSPLTCKVVHDLADAEALRPAWADLLERCERNELTHSPDWLLTWWRVFGPTEKRRLRLALFHDGDRLIGLAPLLARRHWYRGWLPFRRLELLASGEPAEQGIYSNHISILAERGHEAKIASQLVQAIAHGELGRWDEVVLPMMSADTPMPELLVEAFRSAGFAAALTVTAGAPYIPLPATWTDYLHWLSRPSRRHLTRSRRAFDQWSGGTTELECISSPADLERGKQILMSLHHERWNGDSGKAAGESDTAIGDYGRARLRPSQNPAAPRPLERCRSGPDNGVFRAPLFLEFHDRIMRTLAERGALEILILRARGEPQAALYSLTWAGKVIAYQTGRRIDVPNNIRPGGVLFGMAIERAIQLGRREFDLQADEAFYKSQLTPCVRKLVQVRAARPCLVEAIRGFGIRLRDFKARAPGEE